MELLKENRTLVIVVALLVLAYLLWDVEVVKNARLTVVAQWSSMGTVSKVVAVLVVLAVVYYFWTCRQ